MSGPRVITQQLGGSALTQAAIDGVVPEGWYARRPQTAGEWRSYVASVQEQFADPAWLLALFPAIAPSGAARDRLDRTARAGGVVVTTGQQPGLFGGPVYTWSKAVAALALADQLEAITGVPSAPVFWAATDDSDFAEGSVTYIATPTGVQALTLPTPEREGVSLRDVPLGDVSALVRELEAGAGSAVYPGALSATRAAYGPDATIGSAYLALLRSQLEPLGIAVLDAGHPAVRAAARPTLSLALERSEILEAALADRDRAIAAAGYTTQVPLVRGLTLVLAEEGGGSRRRVSAASATQVARDATAVVGPNVLLRPVVERAILPTASYVGGPGELAYFAQVSAVAETLGLPAPLVLPRWSGLIVEPHIERLLARHALTFDDLRDPHAAEGHLARAALPRPVTDALSGFRTGLRSLTQSLAMIASAPDTGDDALLPKSVVAGLTRDFDRRAERLERRVVATAKRRSGEMLRELTTLRAALYPRGKAQERTLNFLPMLARHGPPLLMQMLDRAREHAERLMPADRDG